ncbi:A disintegrin and metalloproteinase with thrombospondin motifs 18-like [Mercenaria mercenaria]|uniref:A disintegrin and metalloproteinase with thrombospondin motifs 18-like n=1 Tax=Mercenaria mercenaria TaxID=6596 RepID=UPI00234F1FC0|nr:A disintegrin and metalloproteinase with thrombospondin motifs 18-like [Mercenaria mercenaria]
MLILNHLLLLLCTGWIQAIEELVWLEDLNTNHDLRNLEIGLPEHLYFNIKRQGGNSAKLHLRENKRLNANAPVYVAGAENGIPTATEADVPPIIGTKFYHDRSAGAAVKCTCADHPHGACQRVLEGSLNIDGDSYEIKPSPTLLSARGMGNQKNLPHIIVKVAPPPEPQPGDRVRGLFGAGYKRIPDENREGASEHDHKKVPDEQNVREELVNELRALLREEQVEDKIQELFVKENRQKRAVGDLYAVEVVMVVDSSLWDKYYSITEGNSEMDKDDATMYFLRERLAHIMNGVSLRYEAIEDPAMDVYVTISEFLFYKNRNTSSPLPSNVKTPRRNDIEYADSDVYIDGLVSWVRTAPITKHNDHVMVITGYELYYGGNIKNDGVAGVAYVGGACGNYRVSVQEDGDYFVLTSVAAHELGHNLGADHDGDESSSACKPDDKNIMAPYITSFSSGETYSVNPWRFSTCSVKAFKDFFGRGRCFKDHGNYYDKDEWNKHNEKLPGERFTPEQQCKLISGDNSYVCSNANNEEICRVMGCFDSRRGCLEYAAARGTPCGRSGRNKWCIDGKCVQRTSVATTTQAPATTTTAVRTTTTTQGPQSTTTTESPQTTSGSCIDIGWYDWSCQKVSDYFYTESGYEPSYWCPDPYWADACCAFCEAATNTPTATTAVPETTTENCVDIGYYNWSCKRISRYFKKTYGLKPKEWCKDPEWKYNCCAYCQKRGV